MSRVQLYRESKIIIIARLLCNILIMVLFIFVQGNFSTLAAVFLFKRQLGFYLLQEFIPTILIVALSWVSFWIDKRSVPARVSLGITTVLALTTLMFGIQASLPRVGHVKAIDVFLMGSFIFVFAALVEYAIICTFSNLFSSGANPNLKGYFQRRVIPTMIFEENENLEITSGESDTFHQVFERKQVEFQVNVLLFLELLRELLGKTVPIGFFHPFTSHQILAQSRYPDPNFRAIPSSRPKFSRIHIISTQIFAQSRHSDQNFRAIPLSRWLFWTHHYTWNLKICNFHP